MVLRSVYGGELTNRRCGVNAVSLCERGYSQPPRVLPLPVWDDASKQIIHVDKFMLSTRRPGPNLDVKVFICRII